MAKQCPVKVHAHHVAIFTSNVDRAIAWWDQMFGFKLVFRNDFPLPDGGLSPMAWVKGDNIYIELYDYPDKGQPAPDQYWGTLGTKHICICCSDEDFEPLIAHLEENGVQFTMRHTWPYPITSKPNGNKVAFILDPDGNIIELQEDFTPELYEHSDKVDWRN